MTLASLLLALMFGGCTTDYQEEHRELYWKRQSGEISELEYHKRLTDLKEAYSRDEVDGVHKKGDIPVWIHPHELNRREEQR